MWMDMVKECVVKRDVDMNEASVLVHDRNAWRALCRRAVNS